MQEILAAEFKQHVSDQEARITLYVYLELCEVKRYYDVEYSFNKNLNKIVITGKKTKQGETSAFVPVTVYEKLNFVKLQSFIHSNANNIVFIVIVHADSTCVYYQLADGLLEPDDTSAKHLKQNRQEQLDNELKRHRAIIEEAALLSRSVTISKSEEQPGCSASFL